MKKLEPLVGEWRSVATPPGGEPWPGEGRVSFAWHPSGAHLVEHSSIGIPEAPDGISIIGCDAANCAYYQLYSDDRGVCRVYEMSIGNGEWKLWREGQPFAQRFHRAVLRDTLPPPRGAATDALGVPVGFCLQGRARKPPAGHHRHRVAGARRFRGRVSWPVGLVSRGPGAPGIA